MAYYGKCLFVHLLSGEIYGLCLFGLIVFVLPNFESFLYIVDKNSSSEKS